MVLEVGQKRVTLVGGQWMKRRVLAGGGVWMILIGPRRRRRQQPAPAACDLWMLPELLWCWRRGCCSDQRRAMSDRCSMQGASGVRAVSIRCEAAVGVRRPVFPGRVERQESASGDEHLRRAEVVV